MNKDRIQFETGQSVEDEIIELHQFFQNWFNGKIVDNISRFTDSMDDNFQLITPLGELFDREKIISAVASGYNTQETRKIWVEDISTRKVDDLIQATYFELQELDGERTKRISSALFSFDPNLPNLSSWRHVHETWI